MNIHKKPERMPALSQLDWMVLKASGVIAVVFFLWALVQPAPPPPPQKPVKPGYARASAPGSSSGPVRDEVCYSIGSLVARGCRPYFDQPSN